MSTLQILMEMGFPENRASRALDVTGNKGVEPAMEWLLAHIDDPIPDDASAGTSSSPPNETTPGAETLVLKPEPESDEAQLAKSIKCNDCQRLFKTQTEVEFHAAKSGHVDFSESTEEKKPLTEEQKRDQLALLETKLKQKRLEREEREKQDELEREKVRIKSGKDMSEARRKMEEEEMKKIVDLRKREKQDEKLARDRVRAQIENDKQARKMRQQSGATSPPDTTTVVPDRPLPQITSSPSVTPGQYSHTRIQIRLPSGTALTQTFSVKEQLAAVRLFVQMNSESAVAFGLMTTFPRKVFSDEDYEKPLDALGLVPSAVIIVTKGQGQMVCIESDGVTTLTTEAEERWKLEKEEERKKYVELLERERQDEKMARDRVLDQIENDKQARQMRQQHIVPKRRSLPQIKSAPNVTPGPSVSAGHTRIQIRRPSGPTLTETFNVRESLAAVRLFVQMNSENEDAFGLMTTYPCKVFRDEDYIKTLNALGLVPSAVIIVTDE